SELKALRAHPAFSAGVDRSALRDYLHRGYVPAPLSIYEGVRKLPPGCLLTLDGDSSRVSIETYWSLRDLSRDGRKHELGAEHAIEELDARLTEAISLQRVADVPVGAFLSGGIDSAVVVAVLQRISPTPVKTFTIGFR